VDTTKEPIRHLSLCAGYGGIDLGLRRVLPACRTIAYVEIEAYAVSCLVNQMQKGNLDSAPIWSDVKTMPLEVFPKGLEILSGGFPCQPFSQAGNHQTDHDKRHLFPYIENAIRTIQPKFVFLENVEGIISSKLKSDYWNDPAGTPVLLHVLRELEREGYYCSWGVFSAEEVGAPHQRRRVFILARRIKVPPVTTEDCRNRVSLGEIGERAQFEELANAKSFLSKGTDNENECGEDSKDRLQVESGGGNLPSGVFPSLPGNARRNGERVRIHKRGLDRAANGDTSGMDYAAHRLQLLGNGCVPATVARAFTVLYEELAR